MALKRPIAKAATAAITPPETKTVKHKSVAPTPAAQRIKAAGAFVSAALPIKRPIMAPPQYRLSSLPAVSSEAPRIS
ncbi:MAG: hypothetical protein RIC52_13635, partial [Amphiplicatus sp.]